MQLQQSVTPPNIYRTRLVSICSYNRLSPHPKYTRHVRYVFAVTTVCHCTQHLPDTFGMYLQLQQSVTGIYRPRSVCIFSYNSLSPLYQHISDTFGMCLYLQQSVTAPNIYRTRSTYVFGLTSQFPGIPLATRRYIFWL